MAHVLPVLLSVSPQLTALPVKQSLDGHIPLLLLLACGMLAGFTLWKQSCPTRSSPTACGGTSHPTVCSDPLTHAHQIASGGSSGTSSCCDEVRSSRGQCPPSRDAHDSIPEERGWVAPRGEGEGGRRGCLGGAVLLWGVP